MTMWSLVVSSVSDDIWLLSLIDGRIWRMSVGGSWSAGYDTAPPQQTYFYQITSILINVLMYVIITRNMLLFLFSFPSTGQSAKTQR